MLGILSGGLIGSSCNLLSASTPLTAAQVVDRNLVARGGVAAWRAIESITFSGLIGAGGNRRAVFPVPIESPGRHGQSLVPPRPAKEVELPFVLELKRPRKVRFELQFAGQTAFQVYDGTSGWKLRPYLNRRVVEPFTSEEISAASEQAELDGRLVDYAAKGTRIDLDGIEKVEGRDNYKLKLTLKDGKVTHEWIDAETFLETKVEGAPRRMDGIDHPVEVYTRDYRDVGSVRIPFVIETRLLPVAKTLTGLRDTPVPPEKLTITKAEINPKLDDRLFSKAQLESPSGTK